MDRANGCTYMVQSKLALSVVHCSLSLGSNKKCIQNDEFFSCGSTLVQTNSKLMCSRSESTFHLMCPQQFKAEQVEMPTSNCVVYIAEALGCQHYFLRKFRFTTDVRTQAQIIIEHTLLFWLNSLRI